MALPPHASTGEKAWHICYLVICGLVFAFLIAPIIIIIPLSFNAEPYFTFTQEMLTFDVQGYSLRWYDRILTHGMTNPDIPREEAWWRDAWNNSQWIQYFQLVNDYTIENVHIFIFLWRMIKKCL